MKTFYIDKITSTPADALQAFGLAHFLYSILPRSEGNNLKIIDAGDCFQIEIPQPITTEQIKETSFQTLFKAVDTGHSKIDIPRTSTLVVDYKEESKKNSEFFDALDRGLERDEVTEHGYRPPPDLWNHWVLMNVMSADYAFNSLAELWYAHREHFPTLVKIILELFSTRPNSVDKAIDTWKNFIDESKIAERKDYKSSQVQVVNPGMGKGGNKSKANGLSIGGMSGFWILEYLKFAGYFQAAAPIRVRDGNRKTYILRPNELRWDTHLKVYPKFRASLYSSTSIKLDISAVLNYCITFLEQWKAGQEESGFGRFARGKPGDHVSALDAIFYKDLGNAYGMLNQGTLVLPDWIKEVKTLEDANRLQEIFEEHQRIVARNRSLDEAKGHHYNLLRTYRDFLSARDLGAFYRFTRGYSKFVMGQLSAKNAYSPPRFTINNLEVLFMSHDKKLAPILKSGGFLNLATAIRLSTVIPQYQKSQGQKPLYEIRYGLGDKLLRNAQYSDKFIQSLSQFMHDYNRENAQKSETRGQQFRKNITIDDINAIVELMDEFDSTTVANLLVAYGYARKPSPEKESKEELA